MDKGIWIKGQELGKQDTDYEIWNKGKWIRLKVSEKKKSHLDMERDKVIKKKEQG